MKRPVFVLVFGEGGHKAQMDRLVSRMEKYMDMHDMKFVCISENGAVITSNSILEIYQVDPIRSKYWSFKNFLFFPNKYFKIVKCFLYLRRKYDLKALISTGPGLVIPFSFLFKLSNIKIIYIETWSRFETKSITGKVLYYLADRFYIQNESLKKLYPKSIFSGLL